MGSVSLLSYIPIVDFAVVYSAYILSSPVHSGGKKIISGVILYSVVPGAYLCFSVILCTL